MFSGGTKFSRYFRFVSELIVTDVAHLYNNLRKICQGHRICFLLISFLSEMIVLACKPIAARIVIMFTCGRKERTTFGF